MSSRFGLPIQFSCGPPLLPLFHLAFHQTTSFTIRPTRHKVAALMASVPIVQVTMADTPSPTKQTLSDKVAALDIKGDVPQTASPGAVTPTLANPLSSASSKAPSPSPFGSLGGVKDDGTNIGGANARKASVHEGSRMSFTAVGGERKGSNVGTAGSRRPSRRGSGVVTTPSGQQAVFHTRTNVSRGGQVVLMTGRLGIPPRREECVQDLEAVHG